MEKIIVLGSTGNIGKAVLKYLKGKNVDVYAGIQSDEHSDLINRYGATPIIADFTNQIDVNKALQDKDRVFLVTPIMQNPEQVTEKVVNAAKINGVKHFVRSTAAGADSRGTIQLSRWAGASENVLKSSGLNYTIIRPYTFLQNFIHFHGFSIKHHNAFYLPVGNAKTSYVDVDNIGEVIATVLTSSEYFGKTIELSGFEYTHTELAELLSNVLNRTISFIDVPENEARNAMITNNYPEWLTNALMELNYATKQGFLAGFSPVYKTITGKEYTRASRFFTDNKSVFM